MNRLVESLDILQFLILVDALSFRPPQEPVHLIDWDAPAFDAARAEALMSIIAPRHRAALGKLFPLSRRAVFPGYRRTQNGKQVLELRFDDLSGCLRTAEGGSSRQFLILHDAGEWKARLITPTGSVTATGSRHRICRGNPISFSRSARKRSSFMVASGMATVAAEVACRHPGVTIGCRKSRGIVSGTAAREVVWPRSGGLPAPFGNANSVRIPRRY